MSQARELADGRVSGSRLLLRDAAAGRAAYWEEFFAFDSIKDAHARTQCRDENGTRAVGVLQLPIARSGSTRGSNVKANRFEP